jgi:hypothetical protein
MKATRAAGKLWRSCGEAVEKLLLLQGLCAHLNVILT